MKKETKLDKIFRFSKTILKNHFWKLLALLFLAGAFWSGWECNTKYFDFKKPQIERPK